MHPVSFFSGNIFIEVEILHMPPKIKIIGQDIDKHDDEVNGERQSR
jgi:hypothetical protein